MVTINQLAEIIMKVAQKKLSIKHIDGPWVYEEKFR